MTGNHQSMKTLTDLSIQNLRPKTKRDKVSALR